MSDDFDKASELEELHRANAIKEARAKNANPDRYTGRCLNCNEQIKDGRFCDVDCRSDYELIQNARIRGNKPK